MGGGVGDLDDLDERLALDLPEEPDALDGPAATDRPTPLQQQQARRAGVSARQAGLPRRQNPYRAGDPRRAVWDGGWLAAGAAMEIAWSAARRQRLARRARGRPRRAG